MRIDKINMDIKSDFDTRKSNNDINFLSQLSTIKKNIHIKDMKLQINNIKVLGERLSITKTYSDVEKYKGAIKDYLKDVWKDTYNINKNKSFWEEKYFNTVDIINEKLNDISNKILEKESENINIVSEIDLIQGLLIDIYI